MNFKQTVLKAALLLAVVAWISGARPAEALLATHDCSFCHDFHGAPSPSGLLKYSSSEVLCLTCHSTINGTTDAAAPHNPRNLPSDQQGYITCRECHNPHDNIGSNIMLVGYKYDPQNNRSFSVPTIREELTTSDPANPVYKTVTFASMTSPTADYYRHDGKGACEICHTSNHLIGRDCTLCHLHSKDFTGKIGFPISPTGSTCKDCHTGTGTDAYGKYSYTAYNVGPNGTHMKIKATDAANADCTACHTSHAATPKVLIPNNATVGINYSANGETGIALGGTATSGTTEAEICWNCHDQNNDGDLEDAGDLSEWKGFAYDGYTVTGSKSWATANFNAPGNLIPNRATVSIHSANEIDTDATITKVRASSVAHNVDASGRTSNHVSFSGTKTLEDVKYIRCSYCHDVHNTYGPNNGATKDMGGTVSSSTGGAGIKTIAPTYLRGTWLENPYYARGGGTTTAEIPPENTRHTGADYFTNNKWRYGTNNRWGTVTVPRLIANTTGSEKEGGYFIDQNSRWPTRVAASSFVSVTDSAGLCLLCHNRTTDTMDYYTGSSLWNGTQNGHVNSTLGGGGRGNAAGSRGNNIFDARLRNGTAPTLTNQIGYMAAQGFDSPNQSQWGNQSNRWSTYLPWGASTDKYNGAKPDNDDFGIPAQNTGWYNWASAGAQRTTGSTNLRGGDFTNWYNATGIGTDGLDNVRAHNFTCSKCHTPHASGLPALLITNCLDYGISNWVKTANVTLGPTNTGATQKNLVAQQVMNNCHRKSSTSTGWHKLAQQQ